MEVKEEKNQQVTIVEKKHKKFIPILIVIVIILVIIFVANNKEGQVVVKAKSSLDRIVEKSDLETVSFTYNVIAKKCKDENNCNLKSTNINDFKYVVSCKGTLNAGIDFEKVKIDLDKKNKTMIITMPEASIKSANITSLKFLNGEDVPANEFPSARNLCEETTRKKSEEDGKILIAAKEHASDVLQSFYEEWVKAFDKNYKVEVK